MPIIRASVLNPCAIAGVADTHRKHANESAIAMMRTERAGPSMGRESRLNILFSFGFGIGEYEAIGKSGLTLCKAKCRRKRRETRIKRGNNHPAGQKRRMRQG